MIHESTSVHDDHQTLSGNHHEHMAAVDLVDPADATHTAIASGDWFDPAIWSGGEVPDADAHVYIPHGLDITYEGQSDASIFSIGVAGTLSFTPDADSKLVVDTLVVTPSGAMEIGTADNPVTGNIEIVIANNGAIDTGWDPMLLSRGIVSLGDVSIHGEEIDAHIKVSTDPMAGDTSIYLAELPETWSVGDTLVVAGTHNPGHSDSIYQPIYRGHTSETREITAIDGNRVFFAEPLEHNHDTPRDHFKTSVANYSRTVTIRSEDGTDSAVHERGHVMFMGSDDVDVRYAAFVELGRTDKSERSFASSDVDDIAFDSNVQGRYSLHLHQLGTADQDNPIMIEGNAVIGSPGWGIAQHSSHANMYNNATLDIWGASFVSEAGDETGTWNDNISIGNVGTLGVERNHEDVAAGDIARTGSGFWMQSRQIETVDNIAVGARTGFVWIAQGSTEGHDPSVLDQPESVGFGEIVMNQHVPIALALDNETFGSGRGLTVTKGHPHQHHDVRTMIEGFDAWEVRSGIKAQYTAHYTFRDIELIAVDGADPLAQPDFAINFGNNVSDMVVDQPRIDGFEHAYSFTDVFTPSLNPQQGDKQFVVVGGDLQNLGKGVFREADWAERTTLIDPSDVQERTPTVVVTSSNIKNGEYRVFFNGTKFDSLGEGVLPAGTDEYYLKYNDIAHIAERDGYWTRDGAPIILVEAYYVDRLTGEMIKVAHEVGFDDPNLIKHSRWNKSPYNGELPSENTAPVASDDVGETYERMPVVIDLLANDFDAEAANLKIDGLIQPKHGKVIDNQDGTVTFRPDAGFVGQETFSYWVTDGLGAFTKASVAVSVKEASKPAVEVTIDPPIDPTPVDPPIMPTPVDPTPVIPTPVDPPVDPMPVDPKPVVPTPVDPPVDTIPTTLRVAGQAALEQAFETAQGNATIIVEAQNSGLYIDLESLADGFPSAVLRHQVAGDKALDDPLHLVFTGSAGHDVISGGASSDVISGGQGLDRLAGRDGADAFVFERGTMLDIVYDFVDGEDVILLNGIVASDVEISEYRGRDTLLQAGDDRMILRDVDYTDISALDFTTNLEVSS